MENEKVAPAPIKKESYTNRIRKMSDRTLRCETQRVGRDESKKGNYHGVILAELLTVLLDRKVREA